VIQGFLPRPWPTGLQRHPVSVHRQGLQLRLHLQADLAMVQRGQEACAHPLLRGQRPPLSASGGNLWPPALSGHGPWVILSSSSLLPPSAFVFCLTPIDSSPVFCSCLLVVATTKALGPSPGSETTGILTLPTLSGPYLTAHQSTRMCLCCRLITPPLLLSQLSDDPATQRYLISSALTISGGSLDVLPCISVMPVPLNAPEHQPIASPLSERSKLVEDVHACRFLHLAARGPVPHPFHQVLLRQWHRQCLWNILHHPVYWLHHRRQPSGGLSSTCSEGESTWRAPYAHAIRIKRKCAWKGGADGSV